MPPFAKMVCPFTQAPSALQSAEITSAISAGSPRRRWGVRSTKPALATAAGWLLTLHAPGATTAMEALLR